MSHSSPIFNEVPIDVPNRSGFNLDHENIFTLTCGTLTPAYCKPVLPNETFSMGINFQAQLPPMVTDFYGKLDVVYEAFFVPNRILWAGWKDFITHPTDKPRYPAGTPVQAQPIRKPSIYIAPASQIDTPYLEAGALSDYLGMKSENYSVIKGARFDALPFFAYHMVYHHWYRDSRIQSPVFYPLDLEASEGGFPANLPYISTLGSGDNDNYKVGPQFSLASKLGDGVALGQLRQRNWSKGYFTTASPYPQGGGDTEISFDVVNNEGAISISTLRSMNAIQQWKERYNFSYEYADQMKAQYGIYPASAKIEKPIYLGRVVETVYSRSVMQTAPGEGTLTDVVGAKKASTQAIGDGALFQDFTPSEHGYLMVMCSLVPHAYYGTGIARHFIELENEDIPYPLLAGVGDQPIYKWELNGNVPSENGEIFGWTDRYAHYKYDEDEIHGLIRDGQSLEAFALQRGFAPVDDDLELGSEFLQIPTNALDQVQAVETSTQGFSAWIDTFFKLSKISILPAYSLPTLGDLKNTHKENVSRGGSRL